MRKQAGFTLIELIMVIVILGVLSAFALPRFADLGGDARVANINGLAGALKSAANIAHAQQLANGDTANTTVSLEGVDITMVNGYPTANADGIAKAAQVSAGTTAQFEAGSVDYEITAAGGTTGNVTVTYQLRTNCTASYTSANSTTAGTPPVTTFTPISVAVDTSGC